MVLNNAICRVRPLATNLVTRRNFTYGIPRNRISLVEKLGLWSGAMVIIAGPMFWIMGNLKRYQGKE